MSSDDDGNDDHDDAEETTRQQRQNRSTRQNLSKAKVHVVIKSHENSKIFIIL